eukprot:TRINITY_DN33332_c0_g1_i1.p1 TRINITY_DN33332_c0_g1~~TRINITY_DN33332_c0_g1_i1.p1  ORF type:complete len:239 (-),score=66.15 TRINITY_DN33332_c0_g1_i1:100-714(-)
MDEETEQSLLQLKAENKGPHSSLNKLTSKMRTEAASSGNILKSLERDLKKEVKSIKDSVNELGRADPVSKGHSEKARAKAEMKWDWEGDEDFGSDLPDPRNVAKGRCEICIFVLEEKEQHRHPLCSALRSNPVFYGTCVGVLEAMLMYDRWYVWWIYAGCIKRNGVGQLEKVRPCPAHAVCSWIYNPEDKRTFCPQDTNYHPGV